MALNITRKENEEIILINEKTGEEIHCKVIKCGNKSTRLAIEAPTSYFIARSELLDKTPKGE